MGKGYRKESRRQWAQASSYALQVESCGLHLIPATMCGDVHSVLPKQGRSPKPWCPVFSLRVNHVDMADSPHG